MLVLAIKAPGRIPKIDNSVVITYDEMFEKYKQHCKKAHWRTQEGFYLEWMDCDTIKQMKQCVFVYPGDDETASKIRKRYYVLDENNLNY